MFRQELFSLITLCTGENFDTRNSLLLGGTAIHENSQKAFVNSNTIQRSS